MWSTADTARAAVALVACAVVAGCQSGPACTPWKKQQGDDAFRGLSVTDLSLHDRIGFLGRQLLWTTGQSVRVDIEVANCSRNDLVLALRSRFNGAGEAPSAWQRVYLAPGSSARYLEQALDARSSDVQVEVIDANRAQSGPAAPATR